MKELIRFTKMEGAGNDYVYVCTFDQEVPAEEKPALAVRLSDRHFGIGSDGLIFINPSERADFEMEMYNADGSSSEMCGNGIRCVARYVYDHGLTDRTAFTVESGGVSHDLQLTLRDGIVAGVTVDMGAPILETEKIPVLLSPRHGLANFARRQNSAQSASRSAWSFALNSSNTKRRIRASALLRNSGSRSL